MYVLKLRSIPKTDKSESLLQRLLTAAMAITIRWQVLKSKSAGVLVPFIAIEHFDNYSCSQMHCSIQSQIIYNLFHIK
jgi:hypothetical protein